MNSWSFDLNRRFPVVACHADAAASDPATPQATAPPPLKVHPGGQLLEIGQRTPSRQPRHPR